MTDEERARRIQRNGELTKVEARVFEVLCEADAQYSLTIAEIQHVLLQLMGNYNRSLMYPTKEESEHG